MVCANLPVDCLKKRRTVMTPPSIGAARKALKALQQVNLDWNVLVACERKLDQTSSVNYRAFHF